MHIFSHLYRRCRKHAPLLTTILLVAGFLLLLLLLPSPRGYYPEVQELKKSAPQNFKDLSDYFEDIADKKGAVYAFEELKQAVLPENVDLHLMGHVIGDKLYVQQGVSGMQYCTHDFRNACSHSVVVGALLEFGAGILPDVREACKKAPGGKGAYTMCYHGFGHGVLAFLDYDFPDAVQFCSKVGTKEYHEREYIECAGGVVMEMVSGVHDPATWEEKKKKFLPDDDPLSLCRKGFIPEEVRPICYTYITPQLFLAVGGDLGNPTPEAFNKIFDLCSEIPTSDGENRLACFASLGKEFIAFVQERDIRNTEKLDYEQLSTIYTWCTLADEYDAIGACMISALNSIYWGGENNRAVSERFCSIVSDPKHKESCYSRLIENVDYYIDDITYRSAFCSELPPENQPLCKQRLLQ